MRIGIAHAAFYPERVESLKRLLASIGEDDAHDEVCVFHSVRREHAHIWVRRLLEWAATQTRPVTLLNDDVTVCPDFRRVVDAIAFAWPSRLVSLHLAGPEVAKKAREGFHMLSSYWLSGPGYIIWPDQAESILNFMDKMPKEFAESVNEDNFIIQWAWSQQVPMLGTIPALVKHDTSVPSTLGYDHLPLRTSSVSFDQVEFAGAQLTSSSYWDDGRNPPYIENPWLPTALLVQLQRWIRDPGLIPAAKPNAFNGLCWFCCSKPAVIASDLSGCKLCGECLAACASQVIGRVGKL